MNRLILYVGRSFLNRSVNCFALSLGLVAVISSGCATERGGITIADSKKRVPLHEAIAQVEEAINYYQTDLRADHPLPKLSQVEFDFRTATADSIGGSVSGLYVIGLGGSAEKDVMHDVTYTYKKLPVTKTKKASAKPVLEKELIDTIQTAAEAVQGAKIFGQLPFESLKVQI